MYIEFGCHLKNEINFKDTVTGCIVKLSDKWMSEENFRKFVKKKSVDIIVVLQDVFTFYVLEVKMRIQSFNVLYLITRLLSKLNSEPETEEYKLGRQYRSKNRKTSNSIYDINQETVGRIEYILRR